MRTEENDGGRKQGGNDGGRSQEGSRNRSGDAGTQRTARTGGDFANDTRGTTDGDVADGSGAPDADGEQMGPGNNDGPGG